MLPGVVDVKRERCPYWREERPLPLTSLEYLVDGAGDVMVYDARLLAATYFTLIHFLDTLGEHRQVMADISRPLPA